MVEIVVAKYREDVSWITKLNQGHVTVYNKDSDYWNVWSNWGTDVYELVNHPTGREAHTYLFHIIACYETLADTTIFMQGNPFDHNPDILTKVREYNEFDWLSDNWHTCDANGCPHHCNLPVGMIYEGLFNEPFPGEITFIPGAQFAVPAEVIKKKPVGYYIDLYNALEEKYNPWYAWAMERFWRKVFE